MKFTTKILAASLVLVAGIAVAKEGVQDPGVKTRMDGMGVIAQNTKTLADMAQGKAAFDAATAQAAAAAIAGQAALIPTNFEGKHSDPVSEASPKIWENWDDFVSKSEALKTGAGSLDASTLENLQAGIGDVSGACRACHQSYRL